MLCIYFTLWAIGVFKPDWTPRKQESEKVSAGQLLSGITPPLLLIVLVLGSILFGLATPTEAAGIGAFGSLCIAWYKGKLNLQTLKEVNFEYHYSLQLWCFMILIGASIFSLVFRGFGGEELVHSLFENMPGGQVGAILIVMAVIFLLGFILDFIEITFVVVPLVAPALFMMGVDPIWLGIMIAINLQTSFLTPPFGFALFYLRGVAPKQIKTSAIYKGVLPFIIMQILLMVGLAIWPELATALPTMIYGE